MKGLISVCSIFFLLGSVIPVYGTFCFRNRVPAGLMGRCTVRIQDVRTKRACCRSGGTGWTDKSSGKRCQSACDDGVPTEAPAESEIIDSLVKRCYRNRNANGIFGTCDEFLGERTEEDCCRQGGQGLTDRNNGKRCVDTCAAVVDDGPVQFCFDFRSIRNGKGRCRDLLGQKTRLACCQEGGAGWGENINGRRCQTSCESHEEREVVVAPVVVDGGWSDWAVWTPCSVTCEEGGQRRTRICNNPSPSILGAYCTGSPTEQAICDEGHCPINGGWGRWRKAGQCSATCHDDNSIYRSRTRICDNPPPQFNGLPCSGASRRNEKCTELPHCPINGEWTDFSDWSECSQTCGTGHQVKVRTCTNPEPQYDGLGCDGDSEDYIPCENRRPCPIHGNWSVWNEWGSCKSPECGTNGMRYRYRDCVNPKPKFGGNYCTANRVDGSECENPCPVAGGWGEWLPWRPCSNDCNPGSYREVYRLCNNPKPQHGGRCDNPRSNTQYEDCEKLDPCPEELEDGSGSGSGSGEDPNPPCDDEDYCNIYTDSSVSYEIDVASDEPQDECDEFYSLDENIEECRRGLLALPKDPGSSIAYDDDAGDDDPEPASEDNDGSSSLDDLPPEPAGGDESSDYSAS